MNDRSGSVARLGRDGTLILPFTSDQPASLHALTLPSGRWRIEGRGARSPLRVRVWPTPPSATGALLLDGALPAILDLRGGAGNRPVSIEVTPATDGPAELAQLVLTRVLD